MYVLYIDHLKHVKADKSDEFQKEHEGNGWVAEVVVVVVVVGLKLIKNLEIFKRSSFPAGETSLSSNALQKLKVECQCKGRIDGTGQQR